MADLLARLNTALADGYPTDMSYYIATSNRRAPWRLTMNRIVLLTICGGLGGSPLVAQRATCPAIEIGVVAEVQSDSNRSITLPDGQHLLLTESPLVTSTDVIGAHASLTEGQYVLNVEVTAAGAKRVQSFSERNVGRTLVFIVDGQVRRTPRIRDPITGNGFLIGAFTQREAERLANAINTGCRRE